MPRKEKIGKVVSNKMDKTIVVRVDEHRPHEKYGKFQTSTNKFKAHDAENTCNMGDTVRIIESRPLSKDKRWALSEVLERAAQV
jgi:small subunit ribosomal protein S17